MSTKDYWFRAQLLKKPGHPDNPPELRNPALYGPRDYFRKSVQPEGRHVVDRDHPVCPLRLWRPPDPLRAWISLNLLRKNLEFGFGTTGFPSIDGQAGYQLLPKEYCPVAGEPNERPLVAWAPLDQQQRWTRASQDDGRLDQRDRDS